jgi:trk system potassium uptake protein
MTDESLTMGSFGAGRFNQSEIPFQAFLMKIIICGAGQVGQGIAERLSEDNDVTVIDKAPGLVQALSDSLDVQGIVGHGAHPDVLERAGATDADMIIAVTHADEVNMMACEVANAIFNIPTKIARIRAQSYLLPEYQNLFTRANTAIDVVISPELAVGDMVLRRLALPGAFEAIYFAEERVVAMGIALREDCPVVDTPLSQLTELFPDLNAVVVGIVRNDALFVPHGDDQMQIGDLVYVIAENAQTSRTLGLFGHEEKPPGRVLIAGGGNIGLYVARKIEERDPGTRVRIIEASRERAEAVAETLHRTVISARQRARPGIAARGGGEPGRCLYRAHQRRESERAVGHAGQAGRRRQRHGAGVDAQREAVRHAARHRSFIDPRSVTVSTILKHVRRGRIRGVHPVQNGEGEIVEAEALETSPVVGVPLRQAKLPEGRAPRRHRAWAVGGDSRAATR